MKVRVPTEIRVMGQTVEVLYKKKLVVEGTEASGSCTPVLNLIQISLKENTTLAAIESTLAHELFHFILGKSGLSQIIGDYEEAITICQEENFYPLFKFNKRRWKKTTEVEVESLR